jgi:flagellar hook-associated protein 2
MAIRVGGLASGIETDSMVKQLMEAHRIPMTKLTQKKQIFDWQRDAYRELNTKLTTFRNNTVFNMKLESTISPKKATVAGGATGVQVTASPNATAGTIIIDVSSLAKAASNYSSSGLRNVSYVPEEDAPAFSASALLAGEIAANKLNYTSVVDPETNEARVNYKFKINGKEVEVDTTTDTLNTVIAKINQKTNVSAFYDEVTGKVSFMSKESGSVNGADGQGNIITFDDTEGDFLANVLHVRHSTDEIADPLPTQIAATDASFTINGMATTRTSNSFTVNGVQIILTEANPGSPITINVTNDVDKTVDKIKEFISSYNEMLKYLQDLSTQPKYRSFTPLTEEQKADMSDKDIERWETQAKSGLMRNDMIITGAISSMRYGAVDAINTGSEVYKTLSSIGIKTGNYSEQGKLYLEDEAKLRKALEEDPDAVMKMFTANGDERSEQGVASRLHNDLKKSLDQIVTKAGSFITLADESILSKQINRVADDIAAMNKKLTTLETNYYRKFAAFETAINRYNSQSAYLTNAFGGGSA